MLGASQLSHLVFERTLQIGCLYLHITDLFSDFHRALPGMKDFPHSVSSNPQLPAQ